MDLAKISSSQNTAYYFFYNDLVFPVALCRSISFPYNLLSLRNHELIKEDLDYAKPLAQPEALAVLTYNQTVPLHFLIRQKNKSRNRLF